MIVNNLKNIISIISVLKKETLANVNESRY